MALPVVAAILFIGSTLVYYFYRAWSLLPPGPRGIPFIGNILHANILNDGKAVGKWSARYGNVIYVHLFGTPFVFLNSANAAIDLLDKRSLLYSDRPHLPMACDMVGFDALTVLTPLGDRFKLERKLMGTVLNSRAVTKYEPLMIEEERKLLRSTLQDPDRIFSHIRRFTTALIFAAVYGYTVAGDNDPFVRLAEEMMVASSDAIRGGWLVDFFPFMRWIPGLSFHRQAATWRGQIPGWVDIPHESMREHIRSHPDCFCAPLLYPEDGSKVDAEVEESVKWIATSLYGAGSDTTSATLKSFVLFMVQNIRVQKKAQQEIDRVVGRTRLPLPSDRAQLPYLECVFKEAIRCATVVPFTVPHRLTRDDEYEGHLIPEGSWCFGNMWSILHDEGLYEDPDLFFPERFEAPVDAERAKLMNPMIYIFGFGRRRCPGLHFADTSTWLSLASILACFDLAPEVGADGVEVPPKVEYAPGQAIRHLLPFDCRITARHDKVSQIID